MGALHESGIAAVAGTAGRENGHPHLDETALREIPVTLYQATLSLTLPSGTCRFTPTCSHYSYQAIAKYGLLKGSALSAWRILRCQPFSKGGYDPVP
jgi:hypothetical protein